MKFEKIKGSQNHHLFRPYDRNGVLREIIWVKFFKTEKGRLEESLKTAALGDARIARDKRIAEFLGERPRWAGKTFLVEDKFPEFLELKKIKSQGTQDSMNSQWNNHLKDGIGGIALDEMNNSNWLRYVARKRQTHPDRKFFNDRKYLSMFLKWLHEEGLIQKFPKLEDVDPEIEEGKVYPQDEINTLIDCASGDLKDQIQMAFTMFMRHKEIWSLEWSQVDFKKRTIALPEGKVKIREARAFVMSKVGLEILLRRKSAENSQWVFPHPLDSSKPHGRFGIKNHWEKLREETGIEGTFHDWRRTGLTHAFKKPINPALICEYAGLSLEEAQKTYLKFTADDTRAVADLVEVSV